MKLCYDRRLGLGSIASSLSLATPSEDCGFSSHFWKGFSLVWGIALLTPHAASLWAYHPYSRTD